MQRFQFEGKTDVGISQVRRVKSKTDFSPLKNTIKKAHYNGFLSENDTFQRWRVGTGEGNGKPRFLQISNPYIYKGGSLCPPH